ncbi:MAG: NAD(P)-binding domain-containing protein [Streptosporangiaceae bacterium]
MRATIYADTDADVGRLADRIVAVLGYGNQGAAQAQNLRDSGVSRVVVGNRDDEYRPRAVAAGFDTLSIAEAATRGDVVLLLVPDEAQPELFRAEIAPGLRAGDTLVVASGYNVAFGLLDVPDGVDVVMVAPRMIGDAVRSRYLSGEGCPCFVSAERDATGHALDDALAVAKGIGATRAGAVASSVREEAALDLFSEQAVWPLLLAAFRVGYEVLSEAGFSDDAILSEMYLSYEPAEIFTRVAEMGLFGQLPLHSQTSQYGQLRGLAGLDTTELRSRFARVLHDDILSGAFAREWSGVRAEGTGRLDELRARALVHPMAEAERGVRASRLSP